MFLIVILVRNYILHVKCRLGHWKKRQIMFHSSCVEFAVVIFTIRSIQIKKDKHTFSTSRYYSESKLFSCFVRRYDKSQVVNKTKKKGL